MMISPARRGLLTLTLAGAASWLASGDAPGLFGQTRASMDTFRVVNSYPHDTSAYTQGLIFRNGFLPE